MNAIVISNLGRVEVFTDNSFIAERDAALIAAKEVTSVSDMFTQGIAMDAQRELAGLAKLLETSRTAIKAPVLELGRTIDAKAKMLMTGLNEEQIRINRLVTAYQVEEKRKAQAAERARLAEIARIEAEQRKSAEAERKAQAEAEDAFTRTDREAAEKAQHAEQARLAELTKQSQSVRMAPTIAPAKVEGLIVKTVAKFEVTDIWQLAHAFPGMVRIEENTSVINESLRKGMRQCPGLRIWEETVTQTRL